MKRTSNGWALVPLHYFTAGSDGDVPMAGLTFGPNGSLYGTTWYGGGCPAYSVGCGTVYKVNPSARVPGSALEPWTETVLYNFDGENDGTNPAGEVTFDGAGNIYGTTLGSGTYDGGIVYELTPSGSNWTETILHTFSWSEDDGYAPYGRLIFDTAGILYGTSYSGSGGCGDVYKLSPSISGWTETTLHGFKELDGCNLNASVISDSAGNLYGATQGGGLDSHGTVFEVSKSGHNWTFHLLYGFLNGRNGLAPAGPLAMDAAGNLYGTTSGSWGGAGTVYQLTYSSGGWRETVLYQFTGGSDGANPLGGVVVDASGNLYGTAYSGGAYGYGVVWEITR